jgi:uncharacterized protein (TIGR03083 family)
MTSDQDRLRGYVESWRSTVDDVVALLRSLGADDWERPTDLPGWTVRSVAAHLAHLESELSGVKQRRVELPERDHYNETSSRYTELGIVAREDLTGAQITDEIEDCAGTRYEKLLADPPTDGKGEPPRTPGKVGWNWETLLSNRVVDVWMHEQDIRRATGRPGGMNGPGAAHTIQSFTQAFPYAVGKRVAPPSGTTIVLDVRGVHPVHLAVEVNEQGRAVPMLQDPEKADALLRMDVEVFAVLAGGRRAVDDVPVEIEGDTDLGRRVLEALAVTP